MGFLTLIRHAAGIKVNESQIGEGIKINDIEEVHDEEEEEHSIRIYLHVKGGSDELMIRVPYNHPSSAVAYLDRLNAYSFDLADAYHRSDVLVQSADDYIDSDLLKKLQTWLVSR